MRILALLFILFISIDTTFAKISSTSVYVERSDQLDMTCETYSIYSGKSVYGSKSPNRQFFMYKNGFFQIIDLWSNEENKSHELIGQKIIRIDNNKNQYKDYIVKGDYKLYILNSGQVFYQKGSEIVVLGDGLLPSNNGKLSESFIPLKKGVSISDIYHYNDSAIVELDDGSYVKHKRFGHAKYNNEDELLKVYPDYYLNRKNLINRLTIIEKNGHNSFKRTSFILGEDNILGVGNDNFYMKKTGETKGWSTIYGLHKNDEKSDKEYEVETIMWGGLQYNTDYNILGINGSGNFEFTMCYNYEYKSTIPNDGKKYRFYKKYNYLVDGDYGNQFLYVGDEKYGPYYTIHNVIFSDNGESVSFIVSDGKGGSTIYKDNEKLKYNSFGFIFISYKPNTTDLYYPLSDNESIKIYKNNILYKEIINNSLIIDGINYESNMLMKFGIGKEGLSYSIWKYEIVDTERCSGYYDNNNFIKSDCKMIKSHGYNNVKKEVENGVVIKDFPKSDNEEETNDNISFKTGFSKSKLTKQLILSKNNLHKNIKQKKYINIFDSLVSKGSTKKLNELKGKVDKIDKSSNLYDKYKNIFEYLEAKILLELEKREEN